MSTSCDFPSSGGCCCHEVSGIISFEAEQGNRYAKGAMLEISEPEGTPISSIMRMRTPLNHYMTIYHACTD